MQSINQSPTYGWMVASAGRRGPEGDGGEGAAAIEGATAYDGEAGGEGDGSGGAAASRYKTGLRLE